MRTPLILAATLAISLTAKTQPNRDYRHRLSPSRGQNFVDCAAALPRLYDNREFDSIGFYVHQRIQTSPGFESDLYSLAILLAIQQHRFFPDSLGNAYLYYGLDRYIQDGLASRSEAGLVGYYDNWQYDPRPYYEEEFTMIAEWAENLLETRKLTTTEAFLCRTFAGDFDHPRKVIRSNRETLGELNTLLDLSFGAIRQLPVYTWYFAAGIWIPQGQLAVLGNHPSITAIGLGKKNRFVEYDFTLAFRFINSANPYTVPQQGSFYTTRNYFGGCIGFDVTRYVAHTRRFEAGPLAGIAFEGFDVNDGNNENSASGSTAAKSINSLNGNLGWRMNVYLDPRHYIGILGRYNFSRYSNPGGTPLGGNSLSIDCIVGFH